MRRIFCALMLLLLSSGALAAELVPAKAAAEPDPETGSIDAGVYANPYFGLTVKLPPGFVAGLAGPPPSRLGFYVLASLDGRSVSASVLITAQDRFFSVKPIADAAAMTQDFSTAMALRPNMVIDRGPEAVALGGQQFQRLDYHAGGLYRIWLATEQRCHIVIFNLTARDPARLAVVAASLAAMAWHEPQGATPLCRQDYVSAQTLIHKIDPPPIDTTGVNLPVRIIIGADGRVRHVHVISASPAQRTALVTALMQWQFMPYRENGQPADIETGLVFTFKPRGP